MFGLAASMSFGFGSFLASAAAPSKTVLGSLVTNSTPAEIFEVYSEDISQANTTARIVISNLIGQKQVYNGSAKRLISDTASAGVKVYVASNSMNPVVTEGDNANVKYTFTNSAPTGDNVKLANTNVYVRASKSEDVSNASRVSDTSTAYVGNDATNWVQLVNNGVVDTNVLKDLQAVDAGTYNFYYYVESDLFGTTGLENNPLNA